MEEADRGMIVVVVIVVNYASGSFMTVVSSYLKNTDWY